MNFFCDYEKYKILYLYLKKDILPNSQYIYNKSKDYKYLSDKYKYKLFGGVYNNKNVLLNEGNIKKENLSEKSSNDFNLAELFRTKTVEKIDNDDILKADLLNKSSNDFNIADLFETVEYKDKSVVKTKSDLLQDIIDEKKLNDDNKIGKGSYGTVYKYNGDDKKEYVIKYIEKDPVFARESMNGFQLTKNLQECNILYPLAHYKNHIMYEYGGNDLLVLINYIFKKNNFDKKICLMNSLIIFKKIAEHLNCMYKAGYAYTDLKYENVVYKEVDEGTPDSIKVKINDIESKNITIKIIDIDSFVKMEKSGVNMVIKSRITYTPDYNMPIDLVFNDFPYRCPILTGFIAMILLILGIKIGRSNGEPFTQLIRDYKTKTDEAYKYIKTILLKDIYLTIFQKQWLLKLITKSISYYDTDRYKNFDEFIDDLNKLIEKK
jgi:hypothetical protein